MIDYINRFQKILPSVIICAIVFSTIISGQTQGPCQTVSRQTGICVPIKTCTVVTQLLQNAGSSPPPSVIDYVRRSHCGTFRNIHHACCLSSDVSPSTGTNPQTQSSTSESSWNTVGLNILSATRCGQVSGDKISNGELTSLSEFPWMALLEYDTIGDNKYLCGGSIITNRYILTAAHCVIGISSRVVGVRLGEHDLNTDTDCEGTDKRRKCAPPAEDIKIERVIPHPGYNKRSIINDIALLRLERAVEFKSNIKAICLPITQQLVNHVLNRVFVSGWGTTERGASSNVLLKAVIPMKDNSVCQSAFWPQINMTSQQLCAGGENRVDTCKGDSGGPMFFTAVYMGISRHIQFGVVSAGGSVCGHERNLPGIYAKVSSYMNWITNNLQP